MSDKVFVILNSTILSETSTTSRGDISIRSNVESNLFIISTMTLIPSIYANSLYIVWPLMLSVNSSGDVRSVTKFV